MSRFARHKAHDGASEHDDDHVTLQQKVAVSKEMTNLLERRLKELQEIGALRTKGLKLDQDPLASRCYSELDAERQRLAAEQLANELRPSRLARPHGGLDTTSGSMLGPTSSGAGGGGGLQEPASRDNSALESTLQHRRRISAHARPDDAARLKKLQMLKRELQKLEAIHAGRLIDSVVFLADAEPPVPVDMDILLKYVSYRIAVPYDPKYFRYYLMHALSKSIARDLFWFIHCHTFQSNSSLMQEVLVSSVAEKYVSLTNKVQQNKSLFFQSYPYAVANAVVSAFHYFVPGSRNLYDSNFKLQAYILIVRLLSGMEVSAVAVQSSLERLFPEERTAAEEAGKKACAVKPPAETDRDAADADAADSGDQSSGARPSGPSPVLSYDDEDDVSNIAGKLTLRDKHMLGAAQTHHVQLLRTLPPTLLVPIATSHSAATLGTSSSLGVPAAFQTSTFATLSPEREPLTASASGFDIKRATSVPRFGSPSSAASFGNSPAGSPSVEFYDVNSHAGASAAAAGGNGNDAGKGNGATLGSSAGMSAVREPGVLRPTWCRSESATDLSLKSLITRSKRRQLRSTFCASSVSPLVQRFLESEATAIGRPVMLKRTTPVPWSAVGGVDTFHATQPRATHQATIRAELQAARASYAEELSQTRKEDLKVAGELRAKRSAVMSGSQAARSKFCLSITDQLEGRRRRNNKDGDGIGGGIVKRGHPSALLPSPSTLTGIRADASTVDSFKLVRSTDPAWETFRASGLGWNPASSAAEFGLLPQQGPLSIKLPPATPGTTAPSPSNTSHPLASPLSEAFSR